MKRIGDIKDKINIVRFTIMDMIFIVLIFSLLSIIITTFIHKKNIFKSNTTNIDNVYNQIVDKYYQDVNKEELANSAIDGMMKYLDEKYSLYMDEDKNSILSNQLDGTYKGIGVVVEKKDDGIFINNVFKNSSADKAGVKIGDKLVKVDDLDCSNISEVVEYIKNHDEVAMLLNRNGEDLLINVSITDIDNPVVSSKLLVNKDDDYGYIYLKSFSRASYTQFKNALEEVEKSNIKGLIIDLRSNRGGYLDQAADISKLFVRKDKTLYSYKDKNKEIVETDDTDEERNYPIVVLIDRVTASSSELLTLILKESYGAITVGTQTYGKGKIQQYDKLSDSTSIKFTTGVWYSPNHNSIDGVGITPSYTVELNKEYYEEPIDKNDNQLAKALKVLINLSK